ncbi:unnamed protein product [Cuscuta campestris]|uniref:NPH3 domain-containing protein n=1 Tax=Cuscuta campestris TaxID=132261 RepID=A0A484MMA6_9ASTE|nr:unnamed protein product [Cuscuta campestris]
MKFMKLGSRPDTFYTTEALRSVSSEVSSDLIVQVKGCRYLLHKFPLLSKSLRLQRLCSEMSEKGPEASSQHQTVQLRDFPCEPEAFELCAKFCYGITVTVSAYNIVSARCTAEYLEMTEEVERGNLIHKLEAFLSSCILQGWKDAIITLQTTRACPSWAEELGITGRCVDAIALKVMAGPAKANLSRSYSRREAVASWSENRRGWWAEDLAELGVDLYWRTMIAVKSGGRVPASVVGEALRVYACRWLPKVSNSSTTEDSEVSKHVHVLESIVSLLPAEKGAVSSTFLLRLLKAASILRVSSATKKEVAKRVGLQLEDATVKDLLIPSEPSKSETTTCDVDLVLTMLEQFMSQGNPSPPTSPPRHRRTKKGDLERRRSRSAENMDFEFQESRRSSSASHSSKLKVAKLVDGYLQEIAGDPKLPLSKFIDLAKSIPDFSRIDHDDLYKAIDIYLKAHPELNKTERKRLCKTMDCSRLSMEACMHAAQNELLPLRVVVQVLFFEQARAAISGGGGGAPIAELPANIKALLAGNDHGDFKKSSAASSFANHHKMTPNPKLATLKMKLAEDYELDDEDDGVGNDFWSQKMLCVPPSRPRKMFSKLWTSWNSSGHKN